MNGGRKKATMRRAFRFRRVRFETLDVVIEGKPDEVGRAMAMLQAYKLADRKRTIWTPDHEPYGHFLEAEVEETTREGVRSEIPGELATQTAGKSYVVLEFDRRQVRGKVHWLGVRLRKSKKDDVSIGVQLITALMKAAAISEIIDTDQVQT